LNARRAKILRAFWKKKGAKAEKASGLTPGKRHALERPLRSELIVGTNSTLLGEGIEKGKIPAELLEREERLSGEGRGSKKRIKSNCGGKTMTER